MYIILFNDIYNSWSVVGFNNPSYFLTRKDAEDYINLLKKEIDNKHEYKIIEMTEMKEV